MPSLTLSGRQCLCNGEQITRPKECRSFWEAIDARDAVLAARRIVDYMDAIYDIANPILSRLNGDDD